MDDPPQLSIPALLTERVAAHDGETILRVKANGVWTSIAWSALDTNVRTIGQGLLAAGFGLGDVGAIVTDARIEAVYADLAIQGAGGTSVAIDPDADPELLAHILHSSGARFVFVDSGPRLARTIALANACPALGRIVVLDATGDGPWADPRCESLEALIRSGADELGWDSAIASVAPDRPAVLLFPAGMLGMGYPMTHRRLMRAVVEAADDLGVGHGDDRLALLPLANPIERIHGLCASLLCRVVSSYGDPAEPRVDRLRETQPTVLGADTRIWEDIHLDAMQRNTRHWRLSRWLRDRAMALSRLGGSRAAAIDLFVLRGLRRELGLNRLRVAYIAEPSVPPPIDAWTRALGFVIRPVQGPGSAL